MYPDAEERAVPIRGSYFSSVGVSEYGSDVECYINCYFGVHFAPNLAWPLLDFAL